MGPIPHPPRRASVARRAARLLIASSLKDHSNKDERKIDQNQNYVKEIINQGENNSNQFILLTL